jgi:hypothetical protein
MANLELSKKTAEKLIPLNFPADKVTVFLP